MGRDAFAEAVTRRELFWPAGADRALPFQEALQAYIDDLRETKSPEWVARVESLPPELLVLTGIAERLIPQFHAQDNAATLGAQPMFWLTPHFHYFKLLSGVGNTHLETNGLLKPATQLAIQSLLQPKTAWLGNVPMQALARLREEGCNESFRARMQLFTQELSEASFEDIDAVAAGVLRGVQSLLDEHEREAKSIAERLERSLLGTLGMTVLTIGGIMFPGLDPYLGLAALGPIAMFGGNALQYVRERHVLSRSLIGVLSTAKTTIND